MLEQKIGLVFVFVLSHMVRLLSWMNSATHIPQATSVACIHVWAGYGFLVQRGGTTGRLSTT
jgi:hypothetical protein